MYAAPVRGYRKALLVYPDFYFRSSCDDGTAIGRSGALVAHVKWFALRSPKYVAYMVGVRGRKKERGGK
jgi:hypothetical protein